MKKPRILAAIIGVVLLLLAGGGYLVLHMQHSDMPIGQKQGQSNKTSDNSRIRILLAGDVIAHDAINQQAKKSDGSYDYMPMMDQFAPIFKAADIRFCNAANINGGPAFTIGGYPKFNAPTEYARDMGRVGCNMVNVGTNHSYDRNQDAINASIDAWDKVPDTLAVVGHNRNMAEHEAVHYFTIKGVKFAFIAYTTYLNTDAPAQNDYGVNVYSRDYAARQIKIAKAAGAEVILTSMRWGVEYSAAVSSEQRSEAQYLADQGVDLIIGHGSHILEPVEALKGSGGNKTVVWYSIGNFLNTQLPAETLFNGLGVVDLDAKTKQITQMGFLPFFVHYEWSAADAKSENLLARRNIKMDLLENVTQTMIDKNQLQTTVAAQKTRIQNTLNTYLNIPIFTLSDYQK